MPIVTTKQQRDLNDARQIAGDKQERDVAFYLRRAFKDSDDFFVFNDFAFTYNDENAQIDHLVLHRFGFLIIESKSIYGEVKVNQSGEWSRSFNGKWSGIPSPIKQAELQQALLKKMLVENAAKFLGKILGLQQNVGGRKWDAICAVSNTCILHRDNIPTDINELIIKSEAVVEAAKRIGEKGKLKAFVETDPAFSSDELLRIADYLLSCAKVHLPSTRLNPKELAASKVEEAAAPIASKVPEPPRIQCKRCGEQEKLEGRYGKYGYYVKCASCGTNTSMRVPCGRCGESNGKVTKKKLDYWLVCSCGDPYILFQQPGS